MALVCTIRHVVFALKIRRKNEINSGLERRIMTRHEILSETIDKLPCAEHLRNYPRPQTAPVGAGNTARVSWKCFNCGVECISTYEVKQGDQREPGNYWAFVENKYLD